MTFVSSPDRNGNKKCFLPKFRDESIFLLYWRAGKWMARMREPLRSKKLYYKHRVAVGIETVFFFDGFFVGFFHKVVTTESRNHHEQGRFWGMEIGNHTIGDAEIVRREDEFIGPTHIWI